MKWSGKQKSMSGRKSSNENAALYVQETEWLKHRYGEEHL